MTKPLDAQALDALAEKLDKATPGRWEAGTRDGLITVPASPGLAKVVPVGAAMRTGDKLAIAALHNAAPVLIAAAREAAKLREALDEIADGNGCNSRYGPGCDWECKHIARAALGDG